MFMGSSSTRTRLQASGVVRPQLIPGPRKGKSVRFARRKFSPINFHEDPLEVASENMVDDQTNCNGNAPSHNSVIQTNETRPTRRAAIRVRDQLRQDVFNIESDDD